MDDIVKYKPPIWKSSQGGGQVKRILRVKEVGDLIDNLNPDQQGMYKFMKITKKNAQLWCYALFYTGMRLHELVRLKEHAIYNGVPLLDSERGTIWMPKEIFGDVGKQKVVNKERMVFLSFKGRKVMKVFMEQATIPTMISGNNNMRHLHDVFDSMLKASAKKIDLPTRLFSMTRKEYLKDAFGVTITDDKGKPRYKKIQVPMKEPTAGVMVRSFRSTWETYLVSQFLKNPEQMLLITGSMGHIKQTAEDHYLVVGQFDEEDLEDIRRVTEGWSVLHQKEDDKE